MGIITQVLSGEHTHCDDLFAELETLVSHGTWDRVGDEFDRFINAMETHFMGEEEILFPAFEQRTGHTMGPTRVMRMEHSQMRQLFTAMRASVEQQKSDLFLSQSETLLMLMRQHNAKEEQMLYPMSDQVLGLDADSIITQIQQRRK
jgi:hemerythrin-like domain-containing protein